MKTSQQSRALTWTFALSSASVVLEHVASLHFNKYRLSSLWFSGTETKIMLPSTKQDLQRVDGIYKNILYFWSGLRSFEVTLIPPDRKSHNPSCCKENLSKMATWKSTAKFPPVWLWTRLQAINLFCKGFPTKCLKIIFSKGEKKS